MNSSHKLKSIIHRFVRIVIPLALIAGGGAAWAYFQATAPRMEKQTPQPEATVVETTTVKSADAPAIVRAMGTVSPSREVTLKARVSGDVVSLSTKFVPGGHVSKGEEILRLDRADYQVELQKAESALKKAEAALAIEQGSQTIAREER